MTSVCTYPIVPFAGYTRGAAMARALEKPAESNANHGECRAEPQTTTAHGKRRPQRSSHQNGTGKSVPFWNGPRLTSAFAAQVLGQAMKREEAKPSARTAYRDAGPMALATALDERI